MRDEFVKMLPADEFLKVVEKMETFLVWNGAESIIWVNALVADNQFRELVVWPE
jgi:hypothetical protein